MIDILIYVLIAALVLWGLWYILTHAVPAEFRSIGTVVLVVLVICGLIWLLSSFLGSTPHMHRLVNMWLGRT